MFNNTKPLHKSMMNMATTGKDLMKCSVCRRYSTDLINICQSGHIICDHYKQDNLPNSYVITQYKNLKYDDRTSTESTLDVMNNVLEKEDIVVSRTRCKLNIKPRPVSCPDLECRKMLAFDLVFKHFYFDHAKIPKLGIDNNLSEIVLKVSDLGTKSRCVAMILDRKLLNVNLKKIIPDDDNKYNVLLLMGARFSNNIQNMENKQSVVKSNLLLWMCKVNDNDICCSITVLREDKRLGYSYIGEAVYIRDQQDAETMSNCAECLIINGAAVHKVHNNEEKFKVHINILK